MLIASYMPPKDDLIPKVRKLLSQGKTQQEIADELNVSRSTIQRVMPLIKSEIDNFEPMTFITASQMNDQGSPSVVLPLQSFISMVDKSLPILYPARWSGDGEIKQYQQNVILRWGEARNSGYRNYIAANLEKWYNYMEKYGYENDSFVKSYRQRAIYYQENLSEYIDNFVRQNQKSWFGKAIDSLGIRGLTRAKVVTHYVAKAADHFPKEEVDIFLQLVTNNFNISEELYFNILRNNPDVNNFDMNQFQSNSIKDPAREILTKIGEVPEDLVDKMLELKKYDINELKLILAGGFKNEEDIEFAKKGKFKNMKEVRKARKLLCETNTELQQIVEYGWKDGDVLRNAVALGFNPTEYQLYTKTILQNDHIRWNKTEIAWARKNTDTTLKRLTEYSSIRALDFCDFLLDVQEPVYRTDRLMQEHNNLSSPGRKITSEDKFEEFLEEFPQYVEVTAGGLTKILINSDKTLKIEPRISPADFSSLKSLNTNLAKELKKALKQNKLNDSTTDSYAFMVYQLKKHIDTEDGEDLKVVDEVSNLLKLNKQSITNLHQARLARNWVSHKESEQKISPRWKYVELTLTYAQQLSEIER